MGFRNKYNSNNNTVEIGFHRRTIHRRRRIPTTANFKWYLKSGCGWFLIDQHSITWAKFIISSPRDRMMTNQIQKPSASTFPISFKICCMPARTEISFYPSKRKMENLKTLENTENNQSSQECCSSCCRVHSRGHFEPSGGHFWLLVLLWEDGRVELHCIIVKNTTLIDNMWGISMFFSLLFTLIV